MLDNTIHYVALVYLVGACSLLQGALPGILNPAVGSAEEQTLLEFRTHYMGVLRDNAAICRQAGLDCAEISVNEPNGAMYAMVGIDCNALQGIKDDADFSMQILTEENLFVLPGKIFGMDSYVRVVICLPPEKLADAFNRIKRFCNRRKIATGGLAEDLNSSGRGLKRGAEAEISHDDTIGTSKRVATSPVTSSVGENN